MRSGYFDLLVRIVDNWQLPIPPNTNMLDALQIFKFIKNIADFVLATDQPLSIQIIAIMNDSVNFFNLNPAGSTTANKLNKFEANRDAYIAIFPVSVVVSTLSTLPHYCIRGLCLFVNYFMNPTLPLLMDVWDYFAISGFFGLTSSHLGNMLLHVIPKCPLIANFEFQLPNDSYFGFTPLFPFPVPSPTVVMISQAINFPAIAMQQILYHIHCCIEVSTRRIPNIGRNGFIGFRNPVFDSHLLRYIWRNLHL